MAGVIASEVVYKWEGNDWEDREGNKHQECVSYDGAHQRLVHQHGEGLYVVDCVKSGSARDGIFVCWEKGYCSNVRFSPEGGYFAYCLEDGYSVGVAGVLSSIEVDIPVPRSLKDDILELMWVGGKDVAELAVCSKDGIELFKFFYEVPSLKMLKKFIVKCKFATCLDGFVVLGIGSNSLQPYMLRCQNPSKLPTIQINVGEAVELEAEDVGLIYVYSSTYCYHNDNKAGRISLRSLSDAYESDVVLELGCAAQKGTKISVVDNIIVVHMLYECQSLLFDIRPSNTDKENIPAFARAITSLCSPIGIFDSLETSSLYLSYKFVLPNILIDNTNRTIRVLELNISEIADKIISERRNKLIASQFLLLRAHAKEHVINILSKSLEDQCPVYELSHLMNLMCSLYREALESLPKQNLPMRNGVGMRSLLKFSGKKTILTERDIVISLLYPYVRKYEDVIVTRSIFHTAIKARSESNSTSWENVSSSRMKLLQKLSFETFQDSTTVAAESYSRMDTSQIVLSPNKLVQNEENVYQAYNQLTNTKLLPPKPKQFSPPYPLAVTLQYLSSLLHHQILPHRILHTFIFDLCLYYQHDHLARQLIQYHVLLDSVDLLHRLFYLWAISDYRWVEQACLDMSLRMSDLSIIIAILMERGEYLQAIDFLRKRQINSFPLAEILRSAGENVKAQEKDPDIFGNMIASIRFWWMEAKDNATVAMPNLVGCSSWLPDINTTVQTGSTVSLEITSMCYTGTRQVYYMDRFGSLNFNPASVTGNHLLAGD